MYAWLARKVPCENLLLHTNEASKQEMAKGARSSKSMVQSLVAQL